MNDKLDQFRGQDDGTGRPGRGGSVISFGFSKTFASFKNPVYRLYYFSMVGHWSSMNMQMLARSLLVYRISDSGAILGVLALANAIPMIAFTLPRGVFRRHTGGRRRRAVVGWRSGDVIDRHYFNAARFLIATA